MQHGNYLYVDGESHYAMAERIWKKIHGEHADLASAIPNPDSGVARSPRMWHHAESKFFWDNYLQDHIGIEQHVIDRKIYFTTFTGTPDGLHDARVRIRQAGFEPLVILELKELAKQRENRLKQDGLLIKAKGVDIGLAVRMLEDAHNGNYYRCALLTSDIDYLPVIDAVRRMGKQVYVMGCGEGIAKDSPFMYAPEKFVDIGEEFMKEFYILKP